MRYLGKIVGHGLLKRADAADEPIAYDLDMFVRPGSGRTASGEITASADTLRKAFDQRRFRVQVEDGTYFDLFFSTRTRSRMEALSRMSRRAA